MDTLLGIRLFTRRDTFLKLDEVMNLMMFVDHWDGNLPKPAVLKPQPLWTGKQILSIFMPEVNLSMTNRGHRDLKDPTTNDS